MWFVALLCLLIGCSPSATPLSSVRPDSSQPLSIASATPSIGFAVQALVLGDGRVFAIGMNRTGEGSSADIFDPASLSWRVTAAVPQIQQVLAVDTVQGGAVLVVGNGASQALLDVTPALFAATSLRGARGSTASPRGIAPASADQ